ncbi:MAG: Lin0512 family protein [Pseudomonadota bacterium]
MVRILSEFGMGTSLRRGDYTQAAARAVRDALWHNSINAAEVFGFSKEDMRIRVDVGAQNPKAVSVDELKAIFPYGTPDVHVTQGGLDTPRPNGDGPPTIQVVVALTVSFDMERADD